MNEEIDIKKFHESTTKELEAIKDRVRNLIGAANWTDEGKYKEIVLSNVIKRFLPKKFSIGTGHIVAKEGESIKISKQIDLIIYDNSFPVLFTQGNFIITTSSGVQGIIEVKTNIENSNFQSVVDTANENGRFIYFNKKIVHQPLFNGIFSYEGYGEGIPESIKETIKNSALKYNKEADLYLVNNICLNKNYFIRYTKRLSRSYTMYKLPQISFSYFIENLIYYLMREKDIEIEKEQTIWFPINKSQYEEWSISLNEEI